MKKIFIDRDEPAASVVEKIIASPDPDIVIVIPRNAKIADSVSNFNLIRREAESAEKEVRIESVDESVLALAKTAKLEANHPLFNKRASRSLSDIVPVEEASEEPKKTKVKGKKKITLKVVAEGPEEEESEEEDKKEKEAEDFFQSAKGEDFFEETEPEPERRPRRRVKFPRRMIVSGGIVLAILLLGVLVVNTFFVRATIKIDFNKEPWQYQGDVLATKTTAQVNLANKTVPAEVFTEKRNLTQFYPASSKAQVSQKAKGKIRIYNAYSSQPQSLVATTRFQAPDGKIYRLDNQVLVPGAEIKDGKIIPASTITTVTADEPGPSYNSDAINKLTIPGFKGTPKFDGFYGALDEGASGGYVGEKAVPTDQDVAAGEEKLTGILKASLDTNLMSGRIKEFIIPEGASSISVTHLSVNKNTDQNGNFSVMGEAVFTAIGFRESDVKQLLSQAATSAHPDTTFKDLNISYSNTKPALAQGQLTMTLSANGTLTTAFDPDKFKDDVRGTDISTAKETIAKLPGLNDAKVTMWPFWLKKLPQDPGRINVVVQ